MACGAKEPRVLPQAGRRVGKEAEGCPWGVTGRDTAPGHWEEPGASCQASRGLLAWERSLWTLSPVLQPTDCAPQEVGVRPSSYAQPSRTRSAAAGRAPSPRKASSVEPVSGVRSRQLRVPEDPRKEQHVPSATRRHLVPGTLPRPGQAPLPNKPCVAVGVGLSVEAWVTCGPGGAPRGRGGERQPGPPPPPRARRHQRQTG